MIMMNEHLRFIHNETNKNYHRNHPEQHRAVVWAIRHCPLNPVCEICDSTENLERHHPDYDYPDMTTPQKVEMGFVLEPLYEERAKQRQVATLPKKGEKGFQPMSGSIEPHTRDEGKTTEQTAKAVGTSRTTYERGKEINLKRRHLIVTLCRKCHNETYKEWN